MPSINWNESAPAGADSAGLGAQEFRSLKTAIRTGLDGEHNWPSAGGDAGVHRLGSGRPFYGTQSAVSSSGTDGRLMLTSDTSRLFGVGSAATALIGGPTVISAGSFPGTAPQRHYWAVEMGAVAGGSQSFPNSGFSGIPFFVPSLWTSSFATAVLPVITALTPTSFQVAIYNTAGTQLANSVATVVYLSIGTRVL